MEYYAHSGKDKTDRRSDWQFLADHLSNVSVLARELAAAAMPNCLAFHAAAEAAGWLHDLGKYQPAWQDYLLRSVAGLFPKSVPHSVFGAAFALRALEHAPLTACIAGHHSGLADWDAGNKIEVNKLVALHVIDALVRVATNDKCSFPTTIPLPDFEDSPSGMRRLEFWTRMLFSVLIDADRTDTAYPNPIDRPKQNELNVDALLAALTTHAPIPKSSTSSQLNELRNRVFDECVASGKSGCGFFELTVPTGGGKTRSGMAFALAHAKHNKLRRVFVVIPYLSIIEQNAREYRKLFGRNNVLEHHSAVAVEDVKIPIDEPYHGKSSVELASENWDAPIVVTTSVQFLETLLAAATRKCRRLHNIARSVVVFDEAQCLPTHILNPLLDVFRELKTNYGCSIVFSTATQPAFRYSPIGLTHGLKPNELTPILPPSLRDTLYRDLQRVTFVDETANPWDWNELVNRLVQAPALCVLNTRRHAREVWEKLKIAVAERHGAAAVAGVRHLSSSLCAEHRLDTLGRRDDIRPGTVYDRLNRGLPCWVVSTQVIEAGVDIDFPRVFRAIGPLDSIVQAAGRCNREMKQLRGEVIIFRPADEGIPLGLYKVATGEAMTILSEIGPDELGTNPKLFAQYFNTIYNRAATDAGEIQTMREELKFDSVGSTARVIDDSGRSVIVPFKNSSRWVQRIKRIGKYDRNLQRRLQRYTVNLRYNDFRNAQQLGLLAPLFAGKDDGPWVLVEGSYHEDLGVMIAQRPLDDFVQ